MIHVLKYESRSPSLLELPIIFSNPHIWELKITVFFLDVVKCKISYDSSCWKETLAGQVIYQPCPFLLYDSTGRWVYLSDIFVCGVLEENVWERCALLVLRNPLGQIILLEIRERKANGKIRNKLCRKHFAFYQS